MANPPEKSRLDFLRGMAEEAKVKSEAESAAAPEEEIDAIIARLKEKRPAAAGGRAMELAEAVRGGMRPRALDFSRAPAELAKGVTLLGRIYRAFEGPLSKVAAFLADLPFAKGMNADLLAADMTYSAEAYIALVATGAMFFLVMTTAALGAVGAALGDATVITVAPLMGALGFLIFAFFGLRWPAIRAASRALAADKDLPFALRQMATQVKAGVSFNRAIASVAQAEYPVLSPEFKHVLADLDRGASTEEALASLAQRIRSRGLRRAVAQILRALKTGGRVSDVISGIAEDVSFETRMKIRDFTETLNLVSIVYIMIGVVAPVGLTILSAVSQLPLLTGFIQQEYVYMAFGAIIACMIVILFVVQRLEPGV